MQCFNHWFVCSVVPSMWLDQFVYLSHGAIPFNVHPPYGREFLRVFEKAVSEGLCASASFDLCVFSEG